MSKHLCRRHQVKNTPLIFTSRGQPLNASVRGGSTALNVPSKASRLETAAARSIARITTACTAPGIDAVPDTTISTEVDAICVDLTLGDFGITGTGVYEAVCISLWLALSKLSFNG